MNGLTVNLRAVVSTALRGLLLLGLAAAGATLEAQQAQQRIASASVTVNVLPGLTATLTADPPSISSGESTTLTWSTTGASSASLDPGDETIAMDDLASGSKTVSPTATTTYTLTASDGDDDTDDVTATVTVTVTVLAIDSFAANDRSLETGERVTLSWRTTGADRVELQEDSSGDFTVISGASTSPDGSYRRTENTAVSRDFRLVAYAGTQSLISNTVGVTWRADEPDPPCEIDSFSANPDTITQGEDTRLSWSTTNGTGASINQGVGSVTPVARGSVPDDPEETTTYTLTCSGPGGDDTASVEVTVVPPPEPCVIDSFSANPSSIPAGGSSALSWSISDATSASIDPGVGAIAANSVADGSTSVSPDSTTEYELTASGPGGSCSDTVTVTVLPPCVVDLFEASPGTITRGDTSTLEWETSDATSVTLSGVSEALDGSQEVAPRETTDYTLAGSGPGGSCSDTVTVTVVEPPVINSFSASPSTISRGGMSTLTWTTIDATAVSIPGTSGTLPVNGSRSVSPTATQTTYTLTASNSADTPATSSSSVTVTIRPTASLYADPEEIFLAGIDPATLTWSTTHATSAEIDEGVGSVTPVADGSTTVYPDTTTTYTLTATGPGGSASDTATVYTIDSQRALTATLTADPLSITRGGSTTLSWTNEGADSAEIDEGVGAVTPVEGGSVSVSPTATTTYTLTATKGEGDDAVTASASVEVTVTQPDPVIDSFSVDDATPETGETVTLSWTTSHATSVDLQRRSGSSWESVGTVALNGSHSVSRDSAGSESYQLLISRDNLAVLSAPITVTWSDPPAD